VNDNNSFGLGCRCHCTPMPFVPRQTEHWAAPAVLTRFKDVLMTPPSTSLSTDTGVQACWTRSEKCRKPVDIQTLSFYPCGCIRESIVFKTVTENGDKNEADSLSSFWIYDGLSNSSKYAHLFRVSWSDVCLLRSEDVVPQPLVHFLRSITVASVEQSNPRETQVKTRLDQLVQHTQNVSLVVQQMRTDTK
jgi:hypothetical protein